MLGSTSSVVIPQVRPVPGVSARRLNTTGVLVHLRTNNIFELNDTGMRVWELLASHTTVDAIPGILAEEFDVDADEAARTVVGALRTVRNPRPRRAMNLAALKAPPGFPAAVHGWRWALSLHPDRPEDLPHHATRRGDIVVHFAGALTDRASAGYGPLPRLNDAEFVAAIYGRVGVDVFSRLRGAFAAAVVDRAHARTILGRDQAGLEPVFYRVDAGAGTLLSAATAQGVAHAAGTARLNRTALADAVCRRFPDVEETFFADVRRLPAGAYVTLADGRVHVTRYWDPLPIDRPVPWLSAGDMPDVEAARARAIRRCTELGRTAIFLSGGIDSVSIAATAADEARDRGTTAPIGLLLGLPHEACDERPTQLAVSRALGMPHRLLEFGDAVGSTPLLDQALDISRAMSSPLMNAWTPPYLALAHVGRAMQASTILTGIGGDEWFSTSDRAAADMVMRGRLFELRRFRQTWMRTENGRGFLRQSAFRPVAGAMAATLAPRAWNWARARRTFTSDPLWVAPDRQIRAAQRERVARTLSPARAVGSFAQDESRDILAHTGTSMEMEEFHQLGAVGRRAIPASVSRSGPRQPALPDAAASARRRGLAERPHPDAPRETIRRSRIRDRSETIRGRALSNDRARRRARPSQYQLSSAVVAWNRGRPRRGRRVARSHHSPPSRIPCVGPAQSRSLGGGPASLVTLHSTSKGQPHHDSRHQDLTPLPGDTDDATPVGRADIRIARLGGPARANPQEGAATPIAVTRG